MFVMEPIYGGVTVGIQVQLVCITLDQVLNYSLCVVVAGKLCLLCEPRGELGKRLTSSNYPHCYECNPGWDLKPFFSQQLSALQSWLDSE